MSVLPIVGAPHTASQDWGDSDGNQEGERPCTSSQGATEGTKHVETVGRARSRVKCRGSAARLGKAKLDVWGAGYVRVWPPVNVDYPGLRDDRCSRDHTGPDGDHGQGAQRPKVRITAEVIGAGTSGDGVDGAEQQECPGANQRPGQLNRAHESARHRTPNTVPTRTARIATTATTATVTSGGQGASPSPFRVVVGAPIGFASHEAHMPISWLGGWPVRLGLSPRRVRTAIRRRR